MKNQYIARNIHHCIIFILCHLMMVEVAAKDQTYFKFPPKNNTSSKAKVKVDNRKETFPKVENLNIDCTKPDAGFDQNLACIGSTPFTSTSLGAVTDGGIWSQAGTNIPGAVIGNQTSKNSIISSLSIGTYKFIWTVNDCADTVKVVVEACNCSKPYNILPVITKATCNGNITNDDAKIEFTVTGGDKFSITQGSYSMIDYSFGINLNGNAGSLTNIPNPFVKTDYTIRVFNGVNDCREDFTLTLEPTVCACVPPTGLVTNSNSPIIEGNAINLSANAAGATSYSWTGPSSFVSTLQNPSRASATNLMAGVYTVTALSSGTCTATAIVNVVVNPLPCTLPSGLVTNSNSPIIEGNAINLSANAAGATSYSWTGPSSFVSTLQNPSRASATSLMAGIYTITAFSTGTCSATTSLAVEIIKVCPTIEADVDINICAGKTLPLAAYLTGISDQNIKFVYFNTHQTNPNIIYGIPDGIIGTVTNQELTSLKSQATLQFSVPSNPTSKTYHVYAIIDPQPSDKNCRPYSHRHVIADQSQCPCIVIPCVQIATKKIK